MTSQEPELGADDVANAALGEGALTPDYTDGGVPTLGFVRDKIERRAATAMGSAELAQDSNPGKRRAQEQADQAAAAKDKLEAIRRSLHPDQA